MCWKIFYSAILNLKPNTLKGSVAAGQICTINSTAKLRAKNWLNKRKSTPAKHSNTDVPCVIFSG